jgi:holo-[acyl-carrier protein] synthase
MLGLGNDIIEIERIRKSFKNHGEALLNRLLTPKEKAYCLQFKDPVLRFAGRFAAKEAIVKALGSGFGRRAYWQEIEILNDKEGRPIATFAPSLVERFGDSLKVLVSISHCETFATAVAIRIA